MDLNHWFNKGILPKNYVNNMEKYQENLLAIYEEFQLQEQPELDQLQQKELRAIVLTEDWCGDAMLNLPILLRIAEKAMIDVRILKRDDNLELMDQYLTNGKSRSIPIFIFIDKHGNEVAKWGPRAPKVQQFVDTTLASLPAKDTPEYDKLFHEKIHTLTTSYQKDKTHWDAVFNSIITTLMS